MEPPSGVSDLAMSVDVVSPDLTPAELPPSAVASRDAVLHDSTLPMPQNFAKHVGRLCTEAVATEARRMEGEVMAKMQTLAAGGARRLSVCARFSEMFSADSRGEVATLLRSYLLQHGMCTKSSVSKDKTGAWCVTVLHVVHPATTLLQRALGLALLALSLKVLPRLPLTSLLHISVGTVLLAF